MFASQTRSTATVCDAVERLLAKHTRAAARSRARYHPAPCPGCDRPAGTSGCAETVPAPAPATAGTDSALPAPRPWSVLDPCARKAGMGHPLRGLSGRRSGRRYWGARPPPAVRLLHHGSPRSVRRWPGGSPGTYTLRPPRTAEYFHQGPPLPGPPDKRRNASRSKRPGNSETEDVDKGREEVPVAVPERRSLG